MNRKSLTTIIITASGTIIAAIVVSFISWSSIETPTIIGMIVGIITIIVSLLLSTYTFIR